MAAAANDPGAASGVLAPPSCGVPSGTPRRSSLRFPLSLPGSLASPATGCPDRRLVPWRALVLAAALLAAACSAHPVPKRASYHAADADLSVTRLVHGPVIPQLRG